MEEKIIERRPRGCRLCFYSDQDDKKRVLIRFINSENNEKSYAVKCPNITTSSGIGCINFKWLDGVKSETGYKKRKNYKRGIIINSLTKEILNDLYFHQNKSLQDIAKEYNCTRPMVQLLMEKYELQRRTQSKARVLAIKEGKLEKFNYHEINENFFSEWSPAMVWVLGLLFTDGCFSGSRVTITSVDIELLEKVKNILGLSKPIAKRIQSYNKSKHIYSLEFYREQMRKDLLKLGLVQRKSLIMQFPEVPEEYMRHFIRGCWDGDGSIYISNGKLNASYVSGSKDFIERLVQELYKAGIHRQHLYHFFCFTNRDETNKIRSTYPYGDYPLHIYKSKRSKSYSIKLSSRENLVKLFYYFYDGVDESMYLTRKYDVFVEGLRLKN
jgi:hypothetical protein